MIELSDLTYSKIQLMSPLLKRKANHYVDRFLSKSPKYGIKIKHWHIKELSKVMGYRIELFYDGIMPYVPQKEKKQSSGLLPPNQKQNPPEIDTGTG